MTFRIVVMLLFVIGSSVFSKEYKGGELRTKESYLYGRFEVRYKASPGSGQTSTFFTYNDIDPMVRWNEIDIEILGRYTDDVQFNVITPQNGQNHVRHQYVNFDPSLGFHTYTIEWTPEYIAWSIDLIEVCRQTGDHITTMIKPQKIMMNIWNPDAETWVGPWYNQGLPKFAYYDYVSYASYTPGSGDVGTDNNFTFMWKDDFESWDQSRWDKATHTFGGNNCDFLPDNVVFQDGYMILCLTDKTNTGFVDKTAPHILWARATENQVLVSFTEALDITSAQATTNYAIPNATIISASLQENNRQVLLDVAGFVQSQNYSLVASGIYDASANRNRLFAQMVNIIMAWPLTFPIKINAGGSALGEFMPDQPWSENVEYGYEDGNAFEASQSLTIYGTDIPQIFRSERHGLVAYRIRVPAGSYNLSLLMAENYFDQPDERVFDIWIEGKMAAQSLDLFAVAGKNTAYVMTASNFEVNDDVLDINFSAQKDFALVNGIIVEKIDTRVSESALTKPAEYATLSNYPNPFNSSTCIRYAIPQDGFVTMEMYDVRGQKITTLVAGNQLAGEHQVRLQAIDLASGIYFCRLHSAQSTQVIRLVLLK
ncbi:MAG: family 16 glycosylhydrolase [Candidatus Zhuqueibacterota bacterium]